MASPPSLTGASSLRDRPPEETLRIAMGWFPSLGISRVTNITRLDRLNLPVYTSIRPRGRSLRVHAGKGLANGFAEVGAAMEAIEFAVAEPQASAWEGIDVAAETLSAQLGRGTQLGDLHPRLGMSVRADDIITAVTCIDLVGDTSVLVPAELIFFPYDPSPHQWFFGGTTNGLASGNTLDEATLHALLEVLERDAIAMNAPRDRSLRVNPSTFPAPFDTMAPEWSAHGVDLVVRSIPNAFDLPCFEARLHEAESDDVNIATGQGLHPDPTIAFTRAVCEAAQSRLSAIHGGRDDLTRVYAKFETGVEDRMKIEQAEIRAFADATSSIDLCDVFSPGWDRLSIQECLDHVLRLIVARGFPHVYRYRFPTPSSALHVVRVVVPGCEQMDHNVRRIGPRLLARVIERE